MNVREASLLPYQREQRQRRLEVAGTVALGGANLSTGLTTLAAGQVASGGLQGCMLDQLSPGRAADAFMPLRIASGALAVVNVGLGLHKLLGGDEEPSRWKVASAVGNFVTAAGLAGQALAWGPWTAAVMGLGIAATVVAEIAERK